MAKAARHWLARIEKVGDKQFVVHYEKDGEKLTMECGMVLFGTGRKPNTDRLNLDVRITCAAAVATLVCQKCQCGMYIADVDGVPFTSVRQVLL